jgi:hypothetical protein
MSHNLLVIWCEREIAVKVQFFTVYDSYKVVKCVCKLKETISICVELKLPGTFMKKSIVDETPVSHGNLHLILMISVLFVAVSAAA